MLRSGETKVPNHSYKKDPAVTEIHSFKDQKNYKYKILPSNVARNKLHLIF